VVGHWQLLVNAQKNSGIASGFAPDVLVLRHNIKQGFVIAHALSENNF
jgi:hypothetical protein